MELGTPSIFYLQLLMCRAKSQWLVPRSNDTGDLSPVGMHRVINRFADEARIQALYTFIVVIDEGNILVCLNWKCLISNFKGGNSV